MNRVVLASAVLTMMGDDAESLWTASDLYAYIQDGVYDFQRKTLCTWRRTPIGDIENQATYALPTDFYHLDRVEYDGWLCTSVSPRDAMSNRGRFESTGNRPLSFMMSGDGLRVIRKLGVPVEDAPDKFYVEYFAAGPELDDETEIPLPSRYLRYLSFYVMAQAYESDGDGQNMELSNFWQAWYERGVELAKTRAEAYTKQRIARLGRDIVRSSQIRRDPGTLPPWFPSV